MTDFNMEFISEKKISEELINIIKSQNLIDIRTPSFLNTKFVTNNLTSFFARTSAQSQ